MAKNQFKPHQMDHKKTSLKEKEKLAIKLKSKLKSAILNEEKKSTENLKVEAKAKAQKSNAKFNTSMIPSTSGFKPKSNQNVNEPNKSKKFNKSSENVKKIGHQQNGGQLQFNGKRKPNQKNKNNQPISSKENKSSNKLNGSKEEEPLQNNVKQKKKKQKKKKKQNLIQNPIPSKSSDDQKISDKTKRKADAKADNDTGKKRFKTVAGFVETNANDEEETKLVKEKLKKKKEKKKLNQQPQSDLNAPKIKVHDIVESMANGSDGNSDSETDSYIDRFFGGGDDGNNFDENRIYSLDDIESDRENGFLSKASGEVTKSKQTASSEHPTQAHKINKKKQKKQTKNNANLKVDSPKNKLVSYRESDDEGEYNFDEFMWTKGDEDDEYTQSDFDDSDGNDMMYGSDSEISLGSEVIESSSDESYESETTDTESMEEYEDDSTYDDYGGYSDSEHDHSGYSDYSENSSARSGDTYDDFLHRRRYDDDHSSNDDHEYTNSAYDDIRIAHGTAISHKITDERIKLFENDTESRIIEVPKSDSDDDSCVDLVPLNVNKSKFLRMEREKIVIKETERKEKLLIEEQKRLAYEKSVEAYYNMDNLHKDAFSSEKNNIRYDSVTVLKCTKNSNHLTLDWLNDCDDEQSPIEEELNFAHPKFSSNKAIVVPIVNPNENKLKPKLNPVKPNITKSKLKLNQSKQDDVQMDQSLNTTQNFNENGVLQSNTEDEAYEEEETSSGSIDGFAEGNHTEPKFFNSVNSRHVLLLLRKTLHFHGSLHVKLIAGKAIAFGYDLQLNKTVTVHSPRGHGLICLIPTSNTVAIQSNLNVLDDLKNDFYVQDLNYLREEFNGGNDAILLLQRDQTNKGVNMIERYMRETVFPNINAFNNESPFYSSEFVLRCKFLNEPANGLVLNDEWSTLNLTDNSKLITIGGKGVGKSTFVRHLINSNFDKFKKFLFIDLDIGQPELFVPQTLSATVVTEPILGPGYLQNVKPAKAVLFGDINVLPDPIKYWRCVAEIHKFCSSNVEFAKMPWIINTMGYSRGFGSELIACILKIFKPTDLVQIESRLNMENFDQIMQTSVVNDFKFNVFKNEMKQISGNCKYTTHVFNAARGRGNHKQTDMNAKDIRYTMILAKLGNCLKFDSDWLTSVKPFEASLNDLSVLVTSGEEINPSDYLDLLNGNLVYLCEKRADNENDIVDCHGIGIVRSVDATTNKLYLLSTIPLTELSCVNVLAIGAIPLPSAVFLNQHSQIRGAVPYVYNSDKFVGSKQVAQHIFRAESNRNNKPIKLMEE